MQAAEKKRPKEEREFLHRLRPFARLQTAEDYEAFATDILCTFTKEFFTFSCFLILLSDEALLRKRIQELQTYRRLGLSTSSDIEKYEADHAKRVCSHPLCSIYFFSCPILF
jgi:transcriptional adapter 2-alpha